MKVISIPLEDLARLTSKDAGELETLVFTQEGEEFRQKDEAPKLIASLMSEKIKLNRDEQYSRGKRETMDAWERELRTRGIEASDDVKGYDLLDRLTALAQKSEQGGNRKAITPDVLESDEAAQAWLTEKASKLKATYEAQIQELNGKLSEVSQAATRGKVQKEALEILEAAKWNAGDDEETRQKRINAMLRLLDYDRVKVDDDGKIIVLDASGHALKDDTFNPVGFAEYVKNINPFGYHRFDPDKGSPSPKHPAAGPNVAPKIVIRDQAHYNELRQQAGQIQDIAKRQERLKEVHEAWIAVRPA